ncbi:hypothetical protein M413DRAFT_148026 [Hebeloma cylindrosporum]|uniref:Uncharacterized protein n=1 Tax=Hebeloma cylindrosporum TaxID=76867 RepID=A0A0C2XUQ9_HEBCY|nr:hypothetical protein M413DRAFT_148026 [Hebeloma cylindrosporum h7]
MFFDVTTQINTSGRPTSTFHQHRLTDDNLNGTYFLSAQHIKITMLLYSVPPLTVQSNGSEEIAETRNVHNNLF